MSVTPQSSGAQPPSASPAPLSPTAHQDADSETVETIVDTSGHIVSVKSLMLGIVLVAGFAELAYIIVNISAMPVYIKAIQLDERWIGIVATAFLVMEGLLKSPFGLLGDRIGRKTLIVAGPMVSVFTAALTPQIHNPYALIGLRILDGVGAAALWPSAFSLIGDFVPEAKRGQAMSMFNLAYILGIALGPALGGNINEWAVRHFANPAAMPPHGHLQHLRHLFTHAFERGMSFYLASVLFAATAIIATLFLPNVRSTHHEHTVEAGGEGFSFQAFKQMLGRMPMTLLMAFVTFLGIGLIMAYVKVFSMERFQLSEGQFGNYLMIPALVIGLVSIPLGKLSDRIGKALSVRAGIGMCVLAFWLLLIFPSVATLVGLGTLIGLGFVVAFPAWMALVTSVCDPKQRGAVVGAVGTAQGLGAIIGVATSGYLYKQPAHSFGFATIPEHGLPFLLCAVMLTCSFILALTTVHEPKDDACATS